MRALFLNLWAKVKAAPPAGERVTQDGSVRVDASGNVRVIKTS